MEQCPLSLKEAGIFDTTFNKYPASVRMQRVAVEAIALRAALVPKKQQLDQEPTNKRLSDASNELTLSLGSATRAVRKSIAGRIAAAGGRSAAAAARKSLQFARRVASPRKGGSDFEDSGSSCA
jgi:hypothetical protein